MGPEGKITLRPTTGLLALTGMDHGEIVDQTITIEVSGQTQRIEQIRPADLFAYVNCYDLVESTGYDLPLVVDLPAGLQLIKTEPSVVHINISPGK